MASGTATRTRKFGVLDAVYERRAVRDYTGELPDELTVRSLLAAAVQAPSAMNRQPWAFVVIQEPRLLQAYSRSIKRHLSEMLPADSALREHLPQLDDPAYDVFYGAGTLMVICSTTKDGLAFEDCCLAAENLMLAAHEFGLGTCPIGLARPWLERPEIKRQLGIPETHSVVLPIVLGVPRRTPPAPGRRDPVILAWRR